jgi:hypothetical protein
MPDPTPWMIETTNQAVPAMAAVVISPMVICTARRVPGFTRAFPFDGA